VCVGCTIIHRADDVYARRTHAQSAHLRFKRVLACVAPEPRRSNATSQLERFESRETRQRPVVQLTREHGGLRAVQRDATQSVRQFARHRRDRRMKDALVELQIGQVREGAQDARRFRVQRHESKVQDFQPRGARDTAEKGGDAARVECRCGLGPQPPQHSRLEALESARQTRRHTLRMVAAIAHERLQVLGERVIDRCTGAHIDRAGHRIAVRIDV
jgi:hypothetical protein